jgi:hypothetical protein
LKVRDAIPGHYAVIEGIHAQMGLDYALPRLDSPLFFVRKVAEDEHSVTGACFLRLAAECYLWVPPNANPRAKLDAISALQPEVLKSAWSQGLDMIEARIPESVERRFQKRLLQLGWSRNRGWAAWSRQTIDAI